MKLCNKVSRYSLVQCMYLNLIHGVGGGVPYLPALTLFGGR